MSRSEAAVPKTRFSKDFYEEHTGRFTRPYQSKAHFLRILRELNLAYADCVLDTGCGASNYLHELSLLVRGICVGIDISSKAVKVAQKPKSRTAAWIIASIDHLPFRNEVFSKILCIHVIEHIPSYRQAIFQMANVLKKGGKLVMTTPNGEMHLLFEEMVRWWSDSKSGHLWRLSCDTLSRCLGRAGLMTIKIQYHGHIFAILKRALGYVISTAHTEQYDQRAWQNYSIWRLLDALDKQFNGHRLLYFTLTATKDDM